MSQPEKRPKVKLDARVSPEFKEKVRDYQQAKGMKKNSEAIIDLIERGLRPDVECLMLQTCEARSEIPSQFGKFINCKRRTNEIPAHTLPIVTLTVQQCLACQNYREIEVSLQNLAQIEAEIQHKEKRNKASERHYQNIQDLIAQGNAKLEEISQTLNVAMKRPVESNPVFHGNLNPTEKPTIQKVESNPQLIKRVVEEKKTTEEFATTSQQKVPLPPEIILCPDIGETVNVEEICKKICQSRATCRYYEEIIVKKAIPKQ
jgi:hypothetical protein